MLAVDKKKYQVAGYTVDTVLFRVSRGGVAIPVEPKVFDLLVYLVRHRDRVVSREELFKAVWDGREVSDATLSNHVKTARKVLGDSGELQQTILTIRGRGYQFIAPVAEFTQETAAPQETAVVASADGPGRRPVVSSLRWPLLIAALLVSALLLGWYVLAPAEPPPAPPYVVVVPFGVSEGVSAEWQPWADEVSRRVIRNLKKISGLRTVDEPSSFALQGLKSLQQIREQLPDVRYALHAVLNVAPDGTLSITPQLEDLQTGRVIWDQPYEGRIDPARFFPMSFVVADAVSASLQVVILEDERRAMRELPTKNQEALRLYVEGRKQLELVTRESLLLAVDRFTEAIRLDGKFFDAYVARATAYRMIFGYYDPPNEMLDKVTSSLDAALALRPGSAEVLSSLGLTYVMAWDWENAWKNLKLARDADPTLALTELGFALYYCALGEAAKVKSSLEAANANDPLNFELADWGNWALFMVGESAAARAWVDQKMLAHTNIGLLKSGAGVGAYIAHDYPRSLRLTEEGALLDGHAVSKIMQAQAYGYAGLKDKATQKLKEADSEGIYTCPYESAVVYLSLTGEQNLERAVGLLQDAVPKRSNCLIFLRVDPRLQPIRDSPRYRSRYEALLKKVGLDEERVRNYPR